MTRRRGGSSPGTVVTLLANTPGAPTFSSNRQHHTTAADNELQFTSYKAGVLLGGPSTLSIAAGVYTPTAYATAWEDAINASLALDPSAEFTVTVSYDATTHKLTVATSSSSFTLALSGVGGVSTAAARCGFYRNQAASSTLQSDTESHGTGTITITIDQNGNGERAQYLIRNITSGKYLALDGSESTPEVWGTPADWSNGGADGTVTATGLTDVTVYTFDAKARNEDLVETVYGSASAEMATIPDMDAGEYSDNYPYEKSGGNTQISAVSAVTGNVAEDVHAGLYGDVTVPYTLQSYTSLTNNSLEVQFSEDYDGEDPDSATWAAATMGTGGSGVSALTASSSGLAKTYVWDSVTDAGGSEYKEVGLRLRAKDSDDAAAGWEYTALFWVNNRPGKIDWETDYPYDKDSTPEVRAIMPSLRGGATSKGYPTIEFRDRATGTLVEALNSYETVSGWWYETSVYADNDVAFVDSDPDTITKTGGTSFVTAGFEVGETITVSGSESNDGTYTIADVAADTIMLDGGDSLTAELAGEDVRLSVWAAMTFAGIPAASADGVNKLRIIVPAGNALDDDEYNITGRMYETRDRG